MSLEFDKYECELLTNCSDNKNDYSVNINKETNMVSIINKESNSVWKLGEANVELVIKLLNMCDVTTTYESK